MKIQPYVVINKPECANRYILQEEAQDVKIPLSKEDRNIVEQLTFQFSHEKNCAGLAAPQIGFHKKIIIFSVPETVLSLREDVDSLIPTTLLINPDFEPLSSHMTRDWEACFSVADFMCEVDRYTEIKYWGYNPSGHLVTDIAKGYAARLIQHEVNHIKGKLITDVFAPEGRRGAFEDMLEIRNQEREQKVNKLN